MAHDPSFLFELFERAVDLDPRARQQLIEGVRARDPDLADELARMLAADASFGSGLEDLVASTAAEWAGPALPSPGDRIGAYTIEAPLGEGGMGVVFSARDDTDRALAIKVLRPGVDTEETLARFRLECTLLARLQHPGICPILDLGSTPEGLPYFVMPRIDGVRIDDFCDAAALGTDERLELFLQVCAVVEHAHARGILHRDLKPSNILVVRAGDRLAPVLIDFGVARVLDPAEGPSGWTRVGRAPGTPAYMSPELLDGEGGPIDTRADVYALGVVLSELLSGARPVRGDTTTRPSELLQSGAVDASETARKRSTDPGSLIRTLRRDVDWIVVRAVDLDRALRYAGVDALADDVRRVLEDRPISARPGDPRYLLLKAWRRAPEVVAGVAAVAVLLLGGALSTTALAAAAQRERSRAEARLAEVERLADGTAMRALLDEARGLPPVGPAFVAEAEAWEARAAEFVDRLPLHRAFSDSLERLGRPVGERVDTTRARLEQWEGVLARVAATRPDPEITLRLDSVRGALAETPPPEPARWAFDDPEAAWLHGSSRQVLAAAERLFDPDPFGGGVADVERRREVSERLAALAETPEWGEAWTAARSRIAASERYAGLDLPVQDGLLPLGPDPESGLEEFWHIASGARPVASADAPGRWAIDGATGIVLVLVPGGTWTMGAQTTDPDAPHYDPLTSGGVAPVHPVRLDPFFIGRYELTRGQRVRLAGSAPDAPDLDRVTGPLAYPTESLSLERAVEVLARVGLSVPTEAQWEVTARAGSSAPVPWSGDDFSSVANLADARFEREATVRGMAFAADVDDGSPGRAPVGSYRPNAWGLHDVIGNVIEVVRGGWVRYPADADGHRAGDGLLAARPGVPAVIRGGGFTTPPDVARVSLRRPQEPSVAEREVGIRAAREVVR
jgi:formylglycine-generating enzyme required for sulfatase activity